MCTKKDNRPPFILPGVGKQIAKHLARLGIHSVQDLLFHLPLRYQDRTHIHLIRELIADQEAVIEGVVESTSKPARGRTKLLCKLKDESGVIHLRFFHLLSFQLDTFEKGTRLRCYSTVRLGPLGLEMIHPEFRVVADHQPIPIDPFLTPIYPATEGLSQYTLRKLTTNALKWMNHHASCDELLPASLLASVSFPTFKEALQLVHRPTNTTPIADLLSHQTAAQKRLAFEELIAHRISLLQLKQAFQSQKSACFARKDRYSQQLLQQLPFQLTKAQARVVNEINADLARSYPMLRLVQGDVGAGKTVVAALAMLQAIENNYQAALMAPTELLAEQHYGTFKKWFEPLHIQVVLLTSQMKKQARKTIYEAIEKGEAQLILGTHALFQENVKFARLALMVVDEQHRFGVQQRALFREKGKQMNDYPHQLVMTATPIPRTLAMSFYADLDCSTLDELPPGRTPIVTSVIASARRDEVITRIRDACKQGRQVYWVCPLIEESEVIACQSATQTAAQLQSLLPELAVGLIHGRMKAEAKETIMRAFQQNEIKLLVATTVIEVGVDVPNASVMIIENAERLGLSQLHQLRGRVGRGTSASYCILLYQQPLSMLATERLKVMRETTDGFKIAQRDLELRGPGELLGTRQTGELSFRVANLLRDAEMLPNVQMAAEILIQNHPQVVAPLMKRWLLEQGEYGKI